MTTTAHSRPLERSVDDIRWRAVAARDATADGEFVYAVKTTGVFCRPSCDSRLPRRSNVEFFPTAAAAERAGYRACMRCAPGGRSRESAHADSVAEACRLIEDGDPPGVGDLAAAVGMSPSHFHRVFKSLTGVTPKGYAAARRADRLRAALRPGATVTSAIYRAGFASSGHFYENASRNLGMKPAAFRDGGSGQTVRFAVGECSLGSILVAASEAGVCAVSLGDDPGKLVEDLQKRFAGAHLVGGDAAFESWVGKVVAFVEHPAVGLDLPLDLQGTAFQQRVWNKLREIPFGRTRTYAQVARDLGAPRSARAVAGACVTNPLAVAIPCHRVVRGDGSLSGYRWGVDRKARLLAAERRSINPHGSNDAPGRTLDVSRNPLPRLK